MVLITIIPSPQGEAPAAGQRPKGQGANIDRLLVPYHAKYKQIQSYIEFIYIYMHQRPFLYWVNVCAKK